MRRLNDEAVHCEGLSSKASTQRLTIPVSGLRQGSLFHVTLVYMTLASALLTVAGVLLSSILKANTLDRRESLFLSSLVRAEQQLRRDSNEAGIKFESETQVTSVSPDQTQIAWTSDRSYLNRAETRGEQIVATDRFVFPAGCRIAFHQAGPQLIALRITEPSPVVKYSAAGSGGTNLSRPAEESTPPTPAHAAQPGVVEIHLKGNEQ